MIKIQIKSTSMKKILFYLVILISILSCDKDEENLIEVTKTNQNYFEKNDVNKAVSSKTNHVYCDLIGSSEANLGGNSEYIWEVLGTYDPSEFSTVTLEPNDTSKWYYQIESGSVLRVYFTQSFTCGTINASNLIGCSEEILVKAPGITNCEEPEPIYPEPIECEKLNHGHPISGPTYMPLNNISWIYNGDTSNIIEFKWWYKKVNGNGEPYVIAYGQVGHFSATRDTFASVGNNSYFEIYLEAIDSCGFHYYSSTYTILKKGRFKLVSPF